MAIGLLSHYASEAVVSPGSRNVPLLTALEQCPAIDKYVVVDERSAGFAALGMSLARGGKPVGLVCTSGTAPLNYGPAVAEAYYRHLPLIVISADRPEEWIGQDDSQTIDQAGVFANYIKGTFDIPVENDEENRMWLINRRLNDAFICACTEPRGPVQINIRLSEPLGTLVETDEEDWRIIDAVPQAADTVQDIEDGETDRLNTMIICGFSHNDTIAGPLEKLARKPNVIVLTEAQSNVHRREGFIPNIDGTLARLPENAPAPDLVITVGGSLTSRKIKEYLRSRPGLIHWSLGMHERGVDVFRKLAKRILLPEETALRKLAGEAETGPEPPSEFKKTWLEASEKGLKRADRCAAEMPWSDFTAFSWIMASMPQGWNLQLSNGTAVRYAQLFGCGRPGSVHCNRGVSGIDGSTSTAIGFAALRPEPTVLISGDMSFQYDIGALAIGFIPPTFKMIVLNNGGGGIFRIIPSTCRTPGFEKYFCDPVNLPLEKLSEAYGFRYFRAENMNTLKEQFEQMKEWDQTACILEIVTDGAQSEKVLAEFFGRPVRKA